MLKLFLALVIPAALAVTWQPGRSTFYQGIDNGNCGYGTISSTAFPYLHIAAVDTPHWASSGSCGQCWLVQCLAGWTTGDPTCCQGAQNVTIQITDQCPTTGNVQWCSGDVEHFDLSPQAFQAIANPSCGVIKTQIARVDCPVQGTISITQQPGTSGYWFAVIIDNVGGSGDLMAVEVMDSSTGAFWQMTVLQSYNAWLIQSSAGFQLPVSIRVSTTDGQVLTFTNVITAFNPGTGRTTTPTTLQFSSNGVTPGPVPSSAVSVSATTAVFALPFAYLLLTSRVRL